MKADDNSQPEHTLWEEAEAQMDQAIREEVLPDSVFEEMERVVDSILGPPKRKRW